MISYPERERERKKERERVEEGGGEDIILCAYPLVEEELGLMPR